MLYSIKRENQLIIRKWKIEAKYESAQTNILKLTASNDALFLANIILNNDIKLTMHNIDITQATPAQMSKENVKSRQYHKKYQRRIKFLFPSDEN